MRTAVAIRSLLLAFALLALSHGAFAQVSISVNFGPPAIPSTSNQSVRPTVIYGFPAIGLTTTTTATTGCPAHGSNRHR
jgi:hypothetical protein